MEVEADLAAHGTHLEIDDGLGYGGDLCHNPFAGLQLLREVTSGLEEVVWERHWWSCLERWGETLAVSS